MIQLLQKRHEIQLDSIEPDVLFYSIFGNEFLKYEKPLKIFFTGENVHPDFNLCDYALGFDWLSLEDRYFRCPNFLLYEEFRELSRKNPLTTRDAETVIKRPRFCNFIYSNAQAHPFRDELFHSLNLFKKVDSAGIHLNNTGKIVGSPSLEDRGTREKIQFQRECRFSLAIENSSTPGYTTEKLIHALVADTIPIYWGDPAVSRQFNPRRMINCHEYRNISQIIEKVKEIEGNPEIAKAILREPIFTGGKVPPALTEEAVIDAIEKMVSPSPLEAKRRNPFVWGKKYEEKRRNEAISREKKCFKGLAWLKKRFVQTRKK